MKTVVYPGSFDPVTKGHLDIIERTAQLFDKLIVVVLINPAKKAIFSVEERVEYIRRITGDFVNVSVDCYDGLLVDYVKSKGASAVVKGLRAMSDFENEFQMALTNKHLYPDMETLFLNTSSEYMFLSSSMVRQLASFGGDISPFIPEEIAEDVATRLAKAT
ncbi:MAG: pantetheine-phosphate adenylyltransferase [Oscillospiraceae bacterium]|nr:pantetheine-phosphate adenylyltransferase [Oscillospiraceae bacterium]